MTHSPRRFLAAAAALAALAACWVAAQPGAATAQESAQKDLPYKEYLKGANAVLAAPVIDPLSGDIWVYRSVIKTEAAAPAGKPKTIRSAADLRFEIIRVPQSGPKAGQAIVMLDAGADLGRIVPLSDGTVACCRRTADTNGDGRVTWTDANEIVQVDPASGAVTPLFRANGEDGQPLKSAQILLHGEYNDPKPRVIYSIESNPYLGEFEVLNLDPEADPATRRVFIGRGSIVEAFDSERRLLIVRKYRDINQDGSVDPNVDPFEHLQLQFGAASSEEHKLHIGERPGATGGAGDRNLRNEAEIIDMTAEHFLLIDHDVVKDRVSLVTRQENPQWIDIVTAEVGRLTYLGRRRAEDDIRSERRLFVRTGSFRASCFDIDFAGNKRVLGRLKPDNATPDGDPEGTDWAFAYCRPRDQMVWCNINHRGDDKQYVFWDDAASLRVASFAKDE